MTNATKVTKISESKRLTFVKNILVILGLVCILLILTVPIPTTLLDILLASTIGFSLMVLVISIVKVKILDFAFYPKLLFMVTLFRFSLNAVSTRFILMDGYAGQVIQTFGTFVTSGNIIVGAIIFLVFVIIQFVVITKTRIPEIAARFTLDAAFDVALKVGHITEERAKEWRKFLIRRKLDPHEVMDGASIGARGDAIVGLIIIGINIASVFIMGSVEKYTVLTIGSGLANQIPALLLSISSGIIVTSKFKTIASSMQKD